MAWFRRPLFLFALACLPALASTGACGRTAIDAGLPSPDSGSPDLVAAPDAQATDGAQQGGISGPDGGTDAGSAGTGPDALDAGRRDSSARLALTVLPGRATVPTSTAVQFNAFVGSGARAEDVTTRVTWSVDEPAIAAITTGAMGGRLTATREGNVTVRAAYLGTEGNAVVKVVDTGITSSVLRPAPAMITLGALQTFRMTATFGDGAIVDVTESASWRTLDAAVATAANGPSMRGVVRGVGVGETTVVASFAGSEAKAIITVRAPSPLTSLALRPATASAILGETFTFSAVGSYSDGTTRDLTGSGRWSSSSTAVAQVSFGRTRCLAAGTATITVTAAGQNATGTIACGVAAIMGVRLTPANSTTVAGARVQFSATVFYRDGTSRDVTSQTTFGTSNGSVATVQSIGPGRGVVTAVAAGSTMISGMYGGVTATTNLVVTAP